MDLALRRRLAVLRDRLELGLDELTQSTIFKTFYHRTRPRERHEENTFARHDSAGIVNLAKKSGFLNRREIKRKGPDCRPAGRRLRIENRIADAKSKFNHHCLPDVSIPTTIYCAVYGQMWSSFND
jgi:hypothetical protein